MFHAVNSRPAYILQRRRFQFRRKFLFCHGFRCCVSVTHLGLQIKFTNLKKFVLKHYHLQFFPANFGGIFSLSIGLSVITVAEFFFFFGTRFVQEYLTSRKTRNCRAKVSVFMQGTQAYRLPNILRTFGVGHR